jgi:hypothetical protein
MEIKPGISLTRECSVRASEYRSAEESIRTYKREKERQRTL